ncbi:hypothetical protein RB601_005808 [Gaeumannomyces tritici]
MCYIYQDIQHCRCVKANAKRCPHATELDEEDADIEFNVISHLPRIGWVEVRGTASNGWFRRHKNYPPTCSDWISEPIVKWCEACKNDWNLPRGFSCPDWGGNIEDHHHVDKMCKPCRKTPSCKESDPEFEGHDDKGYNGYLMRKKGGAVGWVEAEVYIRKKADRKEESCVIF